VSGGNRPCSAVRGRSGEEKAAQWLSRQGYRILERNFRSRYGEVDIIARKDGCLVFIEVKSRSSHRFGTPQEAVTRKKQLRLSRVARDYLLRHGGLEQSCRFDVVAVSEGSGQPRFDLLVNAFEAVEE